MSIIGRPIEKTIAPEASGAYTTLRTTKCEGAGSMRYATLLASYFFSCSLLAITSEELSLHTAAVARTIAREQNRQWLLHYHVIGAAIMENTLPTGMRAVFIRALAKQLGTALPGHREFSIKNLNYMAVLARQYHRDELERSKMAPLPWSHVVLLMCIVPEKEAREKLAAAADTGDWSLTELWKKINEGLDAPPLPPRPKKRWQKLQQSKEEP